MIQTHGSPISVPSARYILTSCFIGVIHFSRLESRALKLRIGILLF
jgi:predicted TIM-barrel enzyme